MRGGDGTAIERKSLSYNGRNVDGHRSKAALNQIIRCLDHEVGDVVLDRRYPLTASSSS